MNKQPLIIDCDTGTDDAIALVCALLNRDQFDIQAVTTVAGNVPLKQTSTNTINLIDMLGHQDIEVAKGASTPLTRELHCAISHGTSGIGDVTLTTSNRSFSKDSACDLIFKKAVECKGELIVLATGPQTNLALALQKYSELKNLIKHIYIMGGCLVGGNMTQASEFNAYVDPEALKIVFDAGIPTTMVGLDVTLQLALPAWVIQKINEMDTKESRVVSDIIGYIRRYNENSESLYEEKNLHDVAAFCSIVNPELFTMKKYYVDVETQGSITRGMTVADFREVYPEHEKNIICAENVNVEGFWNWFVDTIAKSTKL